MLTKIVNDAPSAFDNLQSHERIADAILSLVEGRDGGITIGLEGSWGSGKSSIIKILEKKIESDPDFYLYKFDTWTHQGEPLRRAFLEGLFDKLLGTTWFRSGLIGDTEKNKWQEVRKELSQKIKISTKTTMPKLDVFALLLILSFFCLPLGMSLLSSIITTGKREELLPWATIVFLAPLLFVISTITYKALRHWNSFDRTEQINQVLAKFILKSHNSEAIKTTESAEPSTIEFQEKFNEFMKDALTPPKKRLIIVIDNLDRISEKDVESIWPILRSFVDNPDFTKEEWFKKFWVIIPFAPSSLKAAMVPTDPAPKAITATQGGFLEKIFQITFAVPPPTLSNLKIYLSDVLQKASSDKISATDIQKIFMLISFEKEPERVITPRLIVSIVNNMVATSLQWPKINLVSHAYYSILRRKFSPQEIVNQLTGELLRNEQYMGVLPPTIALDLAVLSCNVDVETAAQILYGEELENTLKSEDGSNILISNYKKIGYPEVLATLLNKNLSESAKNPKLSTIKISNLLTIQVLELMKSSERQHYLQDVRVAIRKLPWISIGNKGFLDIVKFLSKYDDGKLFLDDIFLVLERTKAILESDHSGWHGEIGSSPRELVSNWKNLRYDEAVSLYFKEKFSFSSLKVPGPFADWMKVCGELQQDNLICDGFPPQISLPDIIREFRSKKLYQSPVFNLIAAYRSLEANAIAVEDETLDEVFVSRINRHAELPLNESLLTLRFVIEQAAERKDIFRRLAGMEMEWVFYYFHTIFSENPRKNKEIDMPALHPEKGDPISSRVISNLLFLWIIQGANYGSESMQPVFMSGRAALKTAIADHPYETEILEDLQNLLRLNPEWTNFVKGAIKKWESVTGDSQELRFLKKLM